MYNETLFKNVYFKDLKEKYEKLELWSLLDSLTGVILRNHIINFAKELMANNIPFAFQIIDLDNFKNINDNYGHQMGDSILVNFAKRLEKAVGDAGLVGRYGGDEFIIIYPNIHKYEEVHANITSLFVEGGPLRNTYVIGPLTSFVTGTIGSASFPEDATIFDELFEKADKALYRGKQKGRNCFIIYVDEKHKSINVNTRNKNALHNTCAQIIKAIEKAPSFDIAISLVNDALIDALKITNFLFFKEDDILSAEINKVSNEFGVFTVASQKIAKIDCEHCYQFMKDNGVQSLITYKINIDGKNYGTIMMTESKIHRIWQDDDITMLMMIAEILYYKFIR